MDAWFHGIEIGNTNGFMKMGRLLDWLPQRPEDTEKDLIVPFVQVSV